MTTQVENTGTRTWYEMRQVEHREHFKIERSSGFNAPAIQVAINKGKCHPQRKPLGRVARPQVSRSQAMYWKISSDAYTGFKTWYTGHHGKAYFKVRQCEK